MATETAVKDLAEAVVLLIDAENRLQGRAE